MFYNTSWDTETSLFHPKGEAKLSWNKPQLELHVLA